MTTTIRFIRLPRVRELTGLGPTSIFELERAGKFPRKVQLGTVAGKTARSVAWVESEVMAWVEARIGERDDQLRRRGGDVQATAP